MKTHSRSSGFHIALLIATLFMAMGMGRPAEAATGTSQTSWTNPTTYTNGAVLPAADITGYKFVCTFTPTGATAGVPCTGLSPASINTGARTSVSTTMTYPAGGGTACYQVIVTASGTDADPSAITAQSCKTFDALKPSPVTGVTITVTVTVNLPPGIDAPVTFATEDTAKALKQ